MIAFIKTNLVALLLGFILGGACCTFGTLVYHKASKKTMIESCEKDKLALKKVISECAQKPSTSITNQLTSDIEKNKKGTIVVKFPETIDNNLDQEISIPDPSNLIKETIQTPNNNYKNLKNRKQKGNWGK